MVTYGGTILPCTWFTPRFWRLGGVYRCDCTFVATRKATTVCVCGGDGGARHASRLVVQFGVGKDNGRRGKIVKKRKRICLALGLEGVLELGDVVAVELRGGGDEVHWHG